MVCEVLNGRSNQSSPISAWTYSFDIAAEDSGASSTRNLAGGMLEAGKQLISFRVNGDGDFHVYERNGRGWYTPTGLAGAIIFDDDVQITPLVHNVMISGAITGSSISYDVTIVDSNDVSHQASGITSLNYAIVGSGIDQGVFHQCQHRRLSAGQCGIDAGTMHHDVDRIRRDCHGAASEEVMLKMG